MVRRASSVSSKSTIGPTRQFYLSVNPIVFYNSPSNDKSVNSVMIDRGIYFYMSKSYRLESSRTTAVNIAGIMATHITQLVQKEAQRLIKFWYDTVNMYFNRRAYGLGGRVTPYKPRMKQLGKVRTNYIANSRQHTGQLRRSLIVSNINMFGATLYAKHVHAKTNNVDYIDILMHGAPSGPRAYNPSLDLRVKSGRWRGIPSAYWMIWQMRFQKEVINAERRLSLDIEKYVEQMKVLSQKQIRASRSNRINKEFASRINVDVRNFGKEMSKSKYDEAKDYGRQDPIDAPYPQELTWQGMKEKYYANTIPRNNISWTTELNDVIKAETKRRQRLSGRTT